MTQGLGEDRFDPSRTVKVLGLKLDHDSNEFKFDLEEKFEGFNPDAEKITRRDIVAVASRVFDTQGLVSPYIMQYKKLLPMLWFNKTTWDENLRGRTQKDANGLVVEDPVAAEAVLRFQEWFADMPRLSELSFTRYLDGTLEKIAIFGDASKTGIGAVAYAIKRSADGNLHSQIIYSKSSLMPKILRQKAIAEDALTIARAELLGLVTCINMSEYIRNTLKSEAASNQVHIFTDSLLNLQRLQRGKGKCNPWEERRVCKILDNLAGGKVSFCPGVLNPADLPSRGCNLDELTERLKFWKEGPDFLLKDQSEWPKQPSPGEKSSDENSKKVIDPDLEEDINLYFSQLAALELQGEEENNHALIAQEDPKNLLVDRFLEKFSSLRLMRKIITLFKRAAQRKKGKTVPDGVMTLPEADAAELLLVQNVQEKYLSLEIKALKEFKAKFPTDKKEVPQERVQFKKGSVLQYLPVYWDEKDQVIRLQSRLHKSSTLAFGFVNPIILPKCELAQRLALEIHTLRYHCSQKSAFNTIRQKYWCIGGFRYIKSAIRKGCKTPRCRYISYCSPKMSPLPAIRLDAPDSWTNVGVDYLGPIKCKHSCLEENHPSDKCLSPKTYKVWAAIFTCMHTRAMHVELVPDCTTKEFLEAFRRFVAAQGRPLVFYSDQAKTFKAADKQLKALFLAKGDEDIQNCTYQGNAPVEWKYSTETAPWSNGCTERLVGIFKKQLQIVLQKYPTTFRRLQTLAMEITMSINERPLGITKEGEVDILISPNHLVRGKSLLPMATPSSATMSNMPCDKMWVVRKKVMNHFWTRWQADYLATLSIDKKWLGDGSVLKAGDVVILRPETLEKNQWRMARVTEVHRDVDGELTTASVQLPSGTVFKRTLRQIALLEPAKELLDRREPVAAENPVTGMTQGRGKMCAPEVDGNESPIVSANAGEDREPPSDALSYPELGEPEAENEYAGDGGATTLDPEPQPEGAKEPQVSEEPGTPKRKRARKRPGYYRTLNDGL